MMHKFPEEDAAHKEGVAKWIALVIVVLVCFTYLADSVEKRLLEESQAIATAMP